jgi:hypothetical protein
MEGRLIMALMDFGRIASVLKDSINNNANRDILVQSSGQVQTSDHNFYSGITAITNYEMILGIPNEFLWAVHTWDDAINKVT